MENIQYIVKNSRSFTEVARKLGYSNVSGQKVKQIKELLIDYDTSHFTPNGSKPAKKVKGICPVCGKHFECVVYPSKKEKITCSYSCSNKMFRTAKHKNDDFLNYRTLCFKYQEKKCIICGEQNVVEVHHYDEDRNNNEKTNLIPLCPTHHQYMHSRHKKLINKKVEEYKTFLENQFHEFT